jgi:hypothetical protein
MMRRRKGVGLVMALAIVVVGTALIAAMFNLSSVFARATTWQRRGYTEHVSMSGYVEKAKGFIVELNKGRESEGLPVLHGANVSLDTEIYAVTDLQLTQTENGIANALSLDIPLSTPNGSKRLVMRVYDANYKPEQIKIASWEGKQDLPPSLKLDGSAGGNGSNTEVDGEFEDPSGTGQPLSPEAVNLSAQQYRDYGAYVVRLELYNVLNGGKRVLERDIEEGFFQAINQD